MSRDEDFRSEAENQWCPGCSNFGILTSLKNGCVRLGKKPEEICLVSGIGQAAKLPHYFKSNFFNGLHGRALPVAMGIHSVNPSLATIIVTGEGDCYGEGGNHFIHTIRRNPDITLIVHDNQIYGLTKGQASPTTDVGEITRLQFNGVESEPLQPLAIAVVNGCSFVARGFAGDIPHLSDLLAKAIAFRGFSYVDVVQPCISWGTHSVDWYKERIYKLPAEYDASNLQSAVQKATEWKDRIPIGIIYQNPKQRPLFGESFRKHVYPEKLTELGSPDSNMIKTMIRQFKA
jgi:2-oxoglutarate ferredoxin oxidoreductase subunit beta